MTTAPREKVIGIVGGMGPESTLDLMHKVFAATLAEREQDHVHLIADSNPKIPDRTRFILGEGESPAPAICESIRRVVAAGADLVLIPCNTAHAFFDELQTCTDRPIVNMVTTCAEWVGTRYGPGSCLGLLATTGTIRSGIYERALGERGIRTLVPLPPEQEELMQVIYGAGGVKSGEVERNRERVVRLGRSLVQRGAQGVIAACTEVGLALSDADFPVIDPVRLLAEEAVRIVKGPQGVRWSG